VRIRYKDETGVWKTKTVRGFARKKDAEGYVDGLGIKRGYYRPSPRSSVNQLRDRWLPTLPATRSANTVRVYEAWTGRFAERYGDRQVSELRLDDLERWLTELSRSMSPTTVASARTIVSVMLNQAVKWEIITRNPAKLVAAPRLDTAERSVWDPSQMGSFLSHTETDRLAAAYRLLLTTGVRLGCLLGLRDEDVDLDRSEIRIRQTRIMCNGRVLTGKPKTEKSRRTIALDDRTVAMLRRYRDTRDLEKMVAGDDWQGSGLFFTDEIGRGIHPDNFRRYFARLVKSSGLPRITVHDCRHSYATAALASGVPVKLVSERLGHANIGITLNTYGHVLPGQDAAVAKEVAALIDKDES
jgi:integrase